MNHKQFSSKGGSMSNNSITKYLAAIGRRGGKAKGGAKADSARANGKLGGRPNGKERGKRKRKESRFTAPRARE